MDNSDKLFAEHVTSVAFHLTLSRQMIAAIADVADKYLPGSTARHMGMRDNWVGSARGLVYAPDPSWPGRLELTEAGVHVVALLRLAGLIGYPVPVQKDCANDR